MTPERSESVTGEHQDEWRLCDVQGCVRSAVSEIRSEFSDRWLPACQRHHDEAWEAGCTVRKLQPVGRVRIRKRPHRLQWLVMWLHSTDSSSWWADTVVYAESAEAAAAKAGQTVEIEEHTSHRDRRLTIRVYGPIPEEYQEFKVAESMTVDKISEGAWS
jgi:hypothetical protein